MTCARCASAGVLRRADGSAYAEWGRNKVLAGVHGPRLMLPARFQDAERGVLRVRYTMAAFSTVDRKRPGPDRRSQEIGKVVADALSNTVLLERFPRGAIDVDAEILESGAGTRCAALTCAAVALADAGIPMKGLVAAVAAGKADGHVMLDLAGAEDTRGEADLPVAVNHTTGEVVLLQMDGHLAPDEFEEALALAVDGCRQVHQEQDAALRRSFAK